MCWTELIRYSACGHRIRRTYPCPYQQDAYQSEPDYLTPCEMYVVSPADEDENGVCEKCVAQGRKVVNISSAPPSATPSVTPSAPGVQHMVATASATVLSEARTSGTTAGITTTSVPNVMDKARATVLSWASIFLGAGGKEDVHWKDVYELEAAFPDVEKKGSDDGSDTESDNSEAGMSTPPTPLFPVKVRQTAYEKRVLPKPQSPPGLRPTAYGKHIRDKLGYITPVLEAPSPQDDYGRKICVELDGWYVVAACLGISVEELHEMVRVLEKRRTGTDEMYGE
jgi:hypothetical protein